MPLSSETRRILTVEESYLKILRVLRSGITARYVEVCIKKCSVSPFKKIKDNILLLVRLRVFWMSGMFGMIGVFSFSRGHVTTGQALMPNSMRENL